MNALSIATVVNPAIDCALASKPEIVISFDFIQEQVEHYCKIIPYLQNCSEEDKMEACNLLHEWRGIIGVTESVCIDDAPNEQWVDNLNTDWFYWTRYKELLINDKHWATSVVDKIDEDSSSILNRLGNPNLPDFSKKGLVIGHVQAGKTANYTALINKALDVGYKIIIVMAGTLETLRSQTQKRLEHDIAGRQTPKKELNKPFGVSKFKNDNTHVVHPITNSHHDFKRDDIYRNGGFPAQQPLLLIIKKNKDTLRSVLTWFKTAFSPRDRATRPVLLIDDEADNASINTKEEEVTAINAGIRALIHPSVFPKCTYVGYTATPYANIFIEPESYKQAIGDDLFPRNFIYCLSTPDSYMGARELFLRNIDIENFDDINDPHAPEVRTIPEKESSILPVNHKRTFQLREIPPSLKEAILTFLLAKTIRVLRGEIHAHCGMLIHVSRYTDVQQHIAKFVEKTFREYAIEVASYSACTVWQDSELMNDLFHTWNKQYADIINKPLPNNTLLTWDKIRHKLPEVLPEVEFFCINSETPPEKRLDYDNYQDGLTAIVIGGMSVARGITIEGLVCSYFVRNTKLYDTLMQMGRWFGHRRGYRDLCRIFMRKETQNWFEHIALATEELRDSIRCMKETGATPMDFGLRVRSSTPDVGLMITAKNRMRSAVQIEDQVSFEGNLLESYRVPYNPVEQLQSVQSLKAFIQRLILEIGSPEVDSQKRGWLWKNVPRRLIIDYLNDPSRHELKKSSTVYDISVIQEYINQNDDVFDILLISSQEQEHKLLESQKQHLANLRVNIPYRNPEKYDSTNNYIQFRKSHFFSPKDEAAGLTDTVIEKIKKTADNSNIPGYKYRNVPNRNPLFMIGLALLCDAGFKQPQTDVQKEIRITPQTYPEAYNTEVAVFGISWTGEWKKHDKKKGVPYRVNQIYLRMIEEQLANAKNEESTIDE